MTQIIRSLRSGQITIPAVFREELAITGDTLLRITLEGGELRIKPVVVASQARDAVWIKKLYEHFQNVREEAKKYSETEINDTIGKAVKATRSSHA